MLSPRNECGMRKFICTTLRPTQLPYNELYDYDKCAKFVADFIKYEPLELAGSLPQHMPSPSAVLKWQAGDCFDMAQVRAAPVARRRRALVPARSSLRARAFARALSPARARMADRAGVQGLC